VTSARHVHRLLGADRNRTVDRARPSLTPPCLSLIMANMRRARDAITGSTLSQLRRRGIDIYSTHYEMHHFELCHSDAKESRGRRGKHGGQRTARSRRSDRTSRGLGTPGWSPTLAGYGQTPRPPATRSLPMETPTKRDPSSLGMTLRCVAAGASGMRFGPEAPLSVLTSCRRYGWRSIQSSEEIGSGGVVGIGSVDAAEMPAV
jgi:hypothetical protein